MQKNSIKILALAALALSLGACGGSGGSQSSTSTSTSEAGSSSTYEPSSETSSEPVSQSTSEPVSTSTSEPSTSTSDPSSSGSESESSSVEPGTLYSLPEILSLDTENQWEHLGERVLVKDLVCQGLWDEGKTIVGGGVVGEYINDLRGLEIHSNEVVTFEHGSGWSALFDVEGTLTDVNGRAVIDDAVVTVTSERIYDESGSYTGGGSAYYWPAVYMDRGNWDEYLGRNMSGALLEGVFQIASMPEVVSQEQGTTFEVVFPGENLDTEDLDNMSLITVHFPEGCYASGIKAFNEYFAEKEVGDFFTFFGTGQYDLVENVGYGLVIDSFGAQFLEDPAEVPEIFNSWADLTAEVNKYYNEPLPELGDERVFSYTYSYGGAATSVIKEEYVFLTDKDNGVCTTINYNYKAADAEDIVDGFVEKLETLGWDENASLGGVFTLTVEEEVVGEIIISAASEAGLSYYYMAAKPVIDPNIQKFTSLVEFVDAYETRVATFFEGFETQLLFISSAEEYVLDLTYETYNFDEYEDEIYDYTFYFNFEEGYAFPEEEFDAYIDALQVEGFEQKLLADYEYTGLYNAESREFIVFCDNDGDRITMEVFVLSEADAAKYVTEIPEAIFDNYDDLKALYEQRAGAFVENFATAIPGLKADLYHIDWSDETYCYDRWEDEIYTYEMSFYFEDGITAEAAGAWAEVLKGNGFVEKRLADYSIDGLFNPNTNEFVYNITVDEETQTLTFNVRVLTDAAVATYIIDIPNLVDLGTATEQYNAAANDAIKAITGEDGAFVSTLLEALGGNNFAEGYVLDDTYAQAYAQYYASYGLFVQLVLEVTVVDDLDLQTAYSQLVELLTAAGFVQAIDYFQEAYTFYNTETGESVYVAGSGNKLFLQVVIYDATSAANFIEA